MVGFALLCLFLELRQVAVFTRPAAFWLLAVLPWVWWVSLSSLGGLGPRRALVALLVRFCLIGVFVMLLAEPRSVRRSDRLSVVYALDLSDSIGEQASDSALRYILETVHAKPGGDEAGLVVFGRDAAVELPPRTGFPYEAINVRIARDGTNIEKALSLAAAMLPAENQGRVVLISDGTHTEGSTARALDELKARDVPVDVVGIQYDYLDEVWLEKLEVPRFVKVGETYEAAVVLSSLRAGKGRLTLRENGEVVYSDEVEFRAGKNRFTLPLYRRPPGYYLYVATVETPRGHDGRTENNTAVNHLYLKGEGRTLVVTDPGGDTRDWERLVAALKAAERHVDVVEAYEFPSDALSLMPYDCILFVNAPADAFDGAQLQ
ncbi:MAG TPA: vWA domain-containing protein, partial [Planctomycetota bacterium]|nr:vWA domain-containing protein [Planctomycetota bacterium]